jgi:hypothetical protein
LLTLSSSAFAQLHEPSEGATVASPAVAAEEPAPPAPVPNVDRPGVSTPAAPLDFCARRPTAGGQEYETQRVVVLNALLSESTEPDREVGPKGELVGTHDVFARVRAGELARQAVMRGLPLPRFLMAPSRKPATAALLRQNRLSLAEARAAAGEDDFVAYSLACSDWLMIPSIERGVATWSRVEKEKTVVVNNETKQVKYIAWSASAPWNIKVLVFKRRGSDFELATTLDGSPGGLAQTAAAIAQGGGEDVAFHSYSSTWPASECSVGQAVDGQPGNLASCPAVEPELTFDLPPTPPEAACGSDDSVSRGQLAMAAVARCEALEASRRAVNLLNLAEKRYWAIHSSLAQRGADFVISSGNSNGVHRGDYYVARDSTQQELGFARITQVGAGGKDAPSVLKFKSGGAPVGTQMYEYALMGVQFGLRPSSALLVSHGDLSSKLAFGGGATIGYDLTRRLAWFDEVWARTNIGYLYASSQERLLTFDLGLDGTTYFGGGLAGIIGLGFSAWFPQIERVDAATTKAVEYSGTSAGGLARIGLEYAFSPDWCVNVGADGRMGLSKAELKNDASLVKYDAGSLLAASGYVALAHTF